MTEEEKAQHRLDTWDERAAADRCRDETIDRQRERDDIAKHVAGSVLLGFQIAHIKSEIELPADWSEDVARRSYDLADALMARGKQNRAAEKALAAQGVKLSST